MDQSEHRLQPRQPIQLRESPVGKSEGEWEGRRPDRADWGREKQRSRIRRGCLIRPTLTLPYTANLDRTVRGVLPNIVSWLTSAQWCVFISSVSGVCRRCGTLKLHVTMGRPNPDQHQRRTDSDGVVFSSICQPLISVSVTQCLKHSRMPHWQSMTLSLSVTDQWSVTDATETIVWITNVLERNHMPMESMSHERKSLELRGIRSPVYLHGPSQLFRHVLCVLRLSDSKRVWYDGIQSSLVLVFRWS